MKISITLTVFVYFLIYLGRAENIEYDSDDTVSIEAADNEEASIDLAVFRAQRDKRESETCRTKSGLPGKCEEVRDCFPRLFPVDTKQNDAGPGGVYNPNLAQFLIEASGLCEGEEAANMTMGNRKVCCATTEPVPDFPLDDETLSIDSAYLKKPCGTIKIDKTRLPQRIVGGRPAVLGEFPWMVAMIRRGSQFCGASLIDNKNVLTAAHCVEFMNKNDVAALRLSIGDLDLGSQTETTHVVRKAKRVLYHKGFTMKNLAHDIALIHLDKPVEFSNTVQPVCLHPGNPPYDTGKEEGDVSGWGTTSSGGSQSTKLLAVTLRVITQKECNDEYAKASKKVGPGMVCAGSPGKDSCQGDSGGPLVTDSRGQAKQIGIVSWGIGCASYPGVYTRVDKYQKWINKNKLN